VGYKIIKKYNPKARVSYAKNLTPFVSTHKWSLIEAFVGYITETYNSLAFEVFQTEKVRWLWITRDVPGIKGTLDYISLNHYYVIYVTIFPWQWSKYDGERVKFLSYGEWELPRSDFGWGMKSSSLADSVRWVNRAYNPDNLSFVISEHGCADRTDIKRQWFLRESLMYLSQLPKDIRVESYIHWTLLDNYEWAEGSKMRFGLYETNFETFERTPRKSAEIFKQIIAAQQSTSK
jgi:beta-glucosidase